MRDCGHFAILTQTSHPDMRIRAKNLLTACLSTVSSTCIRAVSAVIDAVMRVLKLIGYIGKMKPETE
jgi:hypothetical protein